MDGVPCVYPAKNREINGNRMKRLLAGLRQLFLLAVLLFFIFPCKDLAFFFDTKYNNFKSNEGFSNGERFREKILEQ